MASAIPQEILSLIVDYATSGDDKLTPYTLVNKSWQSAFERRIYASVVVLSPSASTSITIGVEKYHEKRGLSLATLGGLTDVRKAYIRRILYRVAVPYWIDSPRGKEDDYTYDNTRRSENDQAFSKGVRALFEYLLTAWTKQTISLDIALQAEYAYVTDKDDDDGHEPNTRQYDDMEDEVAPYWAEFIPDCHLPTAKCITSLQFTRFLIPTEIPCDYSYGGYRCGPEDQISVPAVLKVAAACGTLQTLTLNARYEIPSTEPAMRRNTRDTIAAALSHLPSSVQSIQYIGDSPHNFEGEDYTRLPSMSFCKQDMLCTALHKISMQLKHLHIDDEAVFPELFCPDGGLLQTYWPYLETLHLDRIDDCSDFSAIARYADGSASDNTLLERYINDMYTNAGYAAQRMPRLKDLLVKFQGHELSFGYESGKWVLAILLYGDDNYVPSSRVLEAWKVPGGQLKFYPPSQTLDAIYNSWPPV